MGRRISLRQRNRKKLLRLSSTDFHFIPTHLCSRADAFWLRKATMVMLEWWCSIVRLLKVTNCSTTWACRVDHFFLTFHTSGESHLCAACVLNTYRLLSTWSRGSHHKLLLAITSPGSPHPNWNPPMCRFCNLLEHSMSLGNSELELYFTPAPFFQ